MKVENKTYIEGKEVTLIAEHYGTKLYLSVNGIYVTQYDTVVALIDSIEHVDIDEEFKIHINEKN